MKSLKRLFVLLALVSLVSCEVFVDDDSSCASSCAGDSESPFLTIQEGLNHVTYDGIIRVLDGVYTGFDNKNLNLSSAYISIVGDGSNTTIVDCQNDGYAINYFSGTFHLSGITFQNCERSEENVNATGGGTLRIESTYTTISDVTIQNSHASGPGGAIYILSNTVMIYNSTIEGSTSDTFGGGIFVESADLQLYNTTLRNNQVNSTSNDIACEDASIQADNFTRLDAGTCIRCSVTVIGYDINFCYLNVNAASSQFHHSMRNALLLAILFMLVLMKY